LATDNYSHSPPNGEFSKGGPGWFFVAAAHEYSPLKNLTSEVLYPPSGSGIASNATANGNTITLPIPIASGKVPDIVYIYNTSMSSNVSFSVKPSTLSVDRKTFEIRKKDYYEVDAPFGIPVINADLTDYGFINGSTIMIQVKSPGSYGTGGQSPGLNSRAIVFTKFTPATQRLKVLVEEVTHAFGLAHKCGNWDYRATTPRKSCACNYQASFILNDATPRTPIPWTNNRAGVYHCARHIKAIREVKLESMLGW
jgi:hypothetical protein